MSIWPDLSVVEFEVFSNAKGAFDRAKISNLRPVKVRKKKKIVPVKVKRTISVKIREFKEKILSSLDHKEKLDLEKKLEIFIKKIPKRDECYGIDLVENLWSIEYIAGLKKEKSKYVDKLFNKRLQVQVLLENIIKKTEEKEIAIEKIRTILDSFLRYSKKIFLE